MKVKQPYAEPRIVPLLGDQVIEPGQTVEIPEDQLASFLAAGWKPADAATRKAAGNDEKEGTANDGDR